MHGIVYDLDSGASLSTMCHAQRLTAVAVEEADDAVWIVDKRVRALA